MMNPIHSSLPLLILFPALLYPLFLLSYSENSIKELRRGQAGDPVGRISGRISSAFQISNVAYLEDATAGIAIYDSILRVSVEIGDSVIVEGGELYEFGAIAGKPRSGQLQVQRVGDFDIFNTSRIPPAPKAVYISDVSDDIEGQLIVIPGLRFESAGQAFRPATKYYALDSMDRRVAVYIDRLCELGTSYVDVPTGTVSVTGILGQYKGEFQIIPRMGADLGLSVKKEDTVGMHETLDLVTWNVYWLGWPDATRGPVDKHLQRSRILQIMTKMNADLYALQEVIAADELSFLCDNLTGAFDYILAPGKDGTQKLAFIYNTEIIKYVSSQEVFIGSYNDWPGRRNPFKMIFHADVNGESKHISVYNIHAKANTSTTPRSDWLIRKKDAEALYEYLRHPDTGHVVILGDYNDDVNSSVVEVGLESPYLVFVADTVHWRALTSFVSKQGLATYIGNYKSALDHILITTSLLPFVHNTLVYPAQQSFPSFSTTVSDHLPVITRLSFHKTSTVPHSPARSILRITPNPVSEFLTFRLSLETSQPTVVGIANAIGVEINRIHYDYESSNDSDLVVSAANLPPGVYALRIIGLSGLVASAPFTVIR